MNDVERAIQAVRNGDPKAAEYLGMRDSETPHGLGAFRDQVAAVLIEALAHPSSSLRFEAAWALLSFRDYAPSAAAPLVKLLNDPDAATRAQAAETLGELGVTPQLVPELVNALAADDPVISAGVAYALSHLGSEARAAVPSLTAALMNADRNVRSSVANALGEIGPDAAVAVPSLYRLAASADAETQPDFVDAIGGICRNSAAAVQMLRELLGISAGQVRGSAATALRIIAGLDSTDPG